MRQILILTPQTPYPPDQGAPIRNFHLIKHLGQQSDNEVTLLTFTRLDEDEKQRERAKIELQNYCKRVEFVFVPAPRSKITRLKTLLTNPLPDLALRLASQNFAAKLNQLLSETTFDVIQCEGLELAPFVREIFTTEEKFITPHPSPLRSNGRGNNSNPSVAKPKLILDNHNAEYLLQYRAYQSDRQRGLKRWPMAAYSQVQYRRLSNYEAASLQFFDVTIAVSEADKAALLKICPDADIRVLPNGIDIHEYSPSDVPEKLGQLVFTGSMDFRPNVDAMVWFGREVWPLIKREVPNAKFMIVGRRPAPTVKALAALDGIEVTGAVADTRPYIRESSLYIVPMRMGGGVRFKVLEALAMGKAVLTTSMGADGIDLTPGQHAVVANHAVDFANAAIGLLNSPIRRRELAQAGRTFVAEHFAWDKITPALDSIVGE